MVDLKDAIWEIIDEVGDEIETCVVMRESRSSSNCEDCEYERICAKIRVRCKTNEVAELQGY